jgi:subtilisin family serine protease
MKKYFLIILLFTVLPMFAQSPIDKLSNRLKSKIEIVSDSEKILVWVFFTDKGNDLSDYFANPELVVSQKSLDRRAKLRSESDLIDFTDIPVNQNYINQLVLSGFELRNRSKWFNAVSGFIYVNNINQIIRHSFVMKIDLVGTFAKNSNDLEFIDDDNINDYPDQPAGIHVIDYGNSFTQLDQINVPEVHNLGFNGSGITICVMDAGFGNLTHEVFQNLNIIAMHDFVNGSPVMGSHSHGTAVLSILGGYKEGQLIGPAYASDFILARTEDASSETPVEEDNWIAAVEWADSIGVDITSTSLGYLDYDPPYSSYTWEDMDGNTALITIAGDLAVNKGIFVVNSAGNNGYHSTRNTLGAPADGDSIIAVGAVTSTGTRSSFSSVGPTVDGRIKPDVMAMGSSVYYASLFGNGYSSGSGTSFSCPLVSGVSALLLSANPDITPMELREIFRSTSSNNNNPNREYGWGIVDAMEALNLVPVPVELISLSALYSNGSVKLEWVTSTETNNYGFEIQRKTDNSLFQSIGFISGSGTSTNSITYTFTDNDIQTSRYFYRLKQIDFNGSFEYSDEILIEIPELNDYILFQNYPNPFNPTTKLRFSVPQRSLVRITLNDILGRELALLFNEEMDAGTNEIEIDASSLSSGNYFVKMTSGKVQVIKKITLLK